MVMFRIAPAARAGTPHFSAIFWSSVSYPQNVVSVVQVRESAMRHGVSMTTLPDAGAAAATAAFGTAALAWIAARLTPPTSSAREQITTPTRLRVLFQDMVSSSTETGPGPDGPGLRSALVAAGVDCQWK